MMKNRWILVTLLVLLLAIATVALSSCGGGVPELVGNWQNVEKSHVYINFSSDGTAEMGDETGVYICTYEGTGDKEVTMTLKSISGDTASSGQQVIIEYSLSGDELTITTRNFPATFKRVD